MFGVVGVGNLQELERENAFVGVFLATGYDVSALSWLTSVWDTLHFQSGPRWHLAAPTTWPVRGDRAEVAVSNYDVRLSLDLARMYGLTQSDLPCIVLDSFTDDLHQLHIPFPESERDRRRLIEVICRYVASHGPAGWPEDWKPGWRGKLNAGLFDHLQRDQIFRAGLKFVPHVGTLLLKAVARRP
ncbi:MAG: hypothetical protein Q8N10_03375 [Phenylobacterium sp.]|uniref:hypothetical protein n=1 Tax=Phenylobacterium sp. TaxID=1871053 RepID=UPI00272630DA|nr:hypothetical protein [Phenylobacterium sp.]MDO8912311.1 hypothetical protein [Phenylobacterium sp.]MDP3099523.1 hypothetical protein [Phenylobacterium sp.]